ncbi:MAG: MFS transporter [Bacteroidales bacterium]|nr:MFS transporter [Bacteroidales bacterium]
MNRKTLTLLFFTVLINMVGLGIIIPFVPIIFKLKNFFPPGYSAQHINIILGFLLAAYPLAQFFGAPLLGRISDNVGRKKILSLSLFGSMLGYLIFAWGIYQSSIALLFVSRIVDGFTGGNISVAMASIADISADEKAKVRNFGMIGAAFGLGFIIGPAIGGILSDTTISPYFTTVTPFVAAAVVSLINLVMVAFALPETHTQRTHRKVSINYTFVNIKRAFTFKQLKTVFVALFLVNLGWVLFEYFFQVFLYGKFHLLSSHIAYLFVYLGFWIVLSQGYIVRKVSHKISADKILKITLLPTAILLMTVIFVDKTILYFLLPVLAIFTGFTQPNFSAILSDSTEKHSQGEILGIRQSVVSAAQAIAPLAGGFLMNVGNVAKGYQNPLIAGSILALVGWLFILYVKIPKQKISFAENA